MGLPGHAQTAIVTTPDARRHAARRYKMLFILTRSDVKLLSIGPRGGERPAVLLADGRCLDLSRALPGAPASWRRILDAGRLAEVRRLAEEGGFDPGAALSLEDLRLAPPVPDPSKIVCLGLNYRDHCEEQGKPLPERPLLFAKAPSALAGHGEAVVLPDDEPEADYEAELAFVVARRARNVPAARAGDYVLGYTILNDVTGRRAQRTEGQWLRAKGFDTFAPMGPWIVTADELPDSPALDIRSFVNGEPRQASNTRELVFGVPFLVEHITRSMTLEAGDVVSTGTPGGVGAHRDPPVFLRAGDVMRVEIEGVGVLENPVASRLSG